MACFTPLQVTFAPGESGGFFSGRGTPAELPCGYCIGCRKEQARQWATRCMHEVAMAQQSCFITLTYRPECLPDPPSLSKREHQLFIKKLRRRLEPRRISYFLSGEYGDEHGRPHYHAIIFGWWPKDAVPWKRAADGSQLYTSAMLDQVWGLGYCALGAVTFGSALYVAQYVVKKQLKLQQPGSYTWLDPETGEFVCLEPEYACMSRNPAIGKRWLQRYGETDAYRHDQVVMGGVPGPLPRYYDKQLAEADPQRAAEMKRKRYIKRYHRGRADETKARRHARMQVELARSQLKKRNVE